MNVFTVKNKLRQPLVINVPNEDAVHFLAKEQKVLTDTQFNSPELKRHIDLENIVVLRME
jgi:hypothetical protein